MKTIGMFDAKTRLSEICEQVAATHEAVTITKRGRPLVTIGPIASVVLTVSERRAAYMAGPGRGEKPDADDFEPPARSTEASPFGLDDDTTCP